VYEFTNLRIYSSCRRSSTAMRRPRQTSPPACNLASGHAGCASACAGDSDDDLDDEMPTSAPPPGAGTAHAPPTADVDGLVDEEEELLSPPMHHEMHGAGRGAAGTNGEAPSQPRRNTLGLVRHNELRSQEVRFAKRSGSPRVHRRLHALPRARPGGLSPPGDARYLQAMRCLLFYIQHLAENQGKLPSSEIDAPYMPAESHPGFGSAQRPLQRRPRGHCEAHLPRRRRMPACASLLRTARTAVGAVRRLTRVRSARPPMCGCRRRRRGSRRRG
jgi:hypothetical protein